MGACTYGLWLNQKGKTVADGFVLRLSETEHLVWSPRTSVETLRHRLESYLIADEVEIEDAAARYCAEVILGAEAAVAIAARFGRVPAAGEFVQTGEAFAFRGRFSGTENFVCLGGAAAVFGADHENTGASRGTRDLLEAERIASGLPAVPDDIGPEDLPNEGGLDADAISYTKGCYLGQEVMSRLKNLGQVRRRLMVVAGHGEPPAALCAVRQGEKVVGQIRSRARVDAGFVAMAMVSLVNFDRAAPLMLADGRELELRRG